MDKKVKFDKYKELKRVIKRLEKRMVMQRSTAIEDTDIEKLIFINGSISALNEIKRYYESIELEIETDEKDIVLSSEILSQEIKAERERLRKLLMRKDKKIANLKYLKPTVAPYGKEQEEVPSLLVKLSNFE
ncbi:hypothetical protein [Streptobacillus moniliformis]|uniref:hypothetical protein n=1 Tax=Streptobacillus moniliformis TaxID=34105 RepID=UPI0007E2FC91|nr:hypothetical protein [Streptobacillus moniliformis]